MKGVIGLPSGHVTVVKWISESEGFQCFIQQQADPTRVLLRTAEGVTDVEPEATCQAKSSRPTRVPAGAPAAATRPPQRTAFSLEGREGSS